jgi:KaiC/GvpD/RAD55 family RecA-like ATPase
VIAKTFSGVSFLDDAFGGIYAGRSFLVSGRSGTGKSTLGFQFVRQGLQQDERCLILSTMAANDLSILAEALGFSFSMALDEGVLVLLEYQSFIPGRGISDWGTLPPEGFNQLKEIIEANSVKRVVLDTVLPWIAMPKNERLAEHIFSFVRSCDRLGVTTMMTIPKPVSSMAFRLKKALEDVTPISIYLSTTEEENKFTWQTVKYLGEKKPVGMIHYGILPGRGIVRHEEILPVPAAPAPPPARQAPAPARAPAAPPASSGEPVRFSAIVPSPAAPAASPARGRPGAPPSGDQPARLASVWKPDLNPAPPDA